MYSYQLDEQGEIIFEHIGQPKDGWIQSKTQIDATKYKRENNEWVLKPTVSPAEPYQATPEEIKQQKLVDLDWEYEPQFYELKLAWAAANLDENIILTDEIKSDYVALKKEYEIRREEIMNG